MTNTMRDLARQVDVIANTVVLTAITVVVVGLYYLTSLRRKH